MKKMRSLFIPPFICERKSGMKSGVDDYIMDGWMDGWMDGFTDEYRWFHALLPPVTQSLPSSWDGSFDDLTEVKKMWLISFGFGKDVLFLPLTLLFLSVCQVCGNSSLLCV